MSYGALRQLMSKLIDRSTTASTSKALYITASTRSIAGKRILYLFSEPTLFFLLNRAFPIKPFWGHPGCEVSHVPPPDTHIFNKSGRWKNWRFSSFLGVLEGLEGRGDVLIRHSRLASYIILWLHRAELWSKPFSIINKSYANIRRSLAAWESKVGVRD